VRQEQLDQLPATEIRENGIDKMVSEVSMHAVVEGEGGE
jgi:hypothetical protein